MMNQRPKPQGEKPRSEPEIILPGEALKSSRMRTFVHSHGTQRIYIAKIGPLGIILVALTMGYSVPCNPDAAVGCLPNLYTRGRFACCRCNNFWGFSVIFSATTLGARMPKAQNCRYICRYFGFSYHGKTLIYQYKYH